MTRILVVGIGNVLRGDDGFGPAVIEALRGRIPENVRLTEMGIGGVGLVHELMEGYDALIVVDAVDRGGAPGSLYVLEPSVPEAGAIPPPQRHLDMHEAVPANALIVARAAGVLPSMVRIVGCQPAATEEFATTLSTPVAATVPSAADAVLAIVMECGSLPPPSH